MKLLALLLVLAFIGIISIDQVNNHHNKLHLNKDVSVWFRPMAIAVKWMANADGPLHATFLAAIVTASSAIHVSY
jgi:hypothetical protein